MRGRLLLLTILAAWAAASCSLLGIDERDVRANVYGPSPLPAFRLEISGPDTILVGGQARYTVVKIDPNGTREDVTDRANLVCGDGLRRGASNSGTHLCEATSPAVSFVEANFQGVFSNRLVVTSVAATTSVPPGALITSNAETVSFRHRVGASPCPQMIEGPTVTNVSGVPLTISASTPHSALQVGRDEVVIQPGQSLTIALVFNCATQSGFETELTISARTPGGITHTTNVLVVAQISR